MRNWSGSLVFEPGEVVKPESQEALQELVKKAAREGKKIRVAGAGHSSSPLIQTDGYMVSLVHFQGASVSANKENRALVLGGTVIKDAGEALVKHQLALHNTGDVDVQTLAGAIGTGTHGTGIHLQNLSSILDEVKLIDGTGAIRHFSVEKDGANLFNALRLGLGTCGIFLEVGVAVQPAYNLFRKEWCVSIENCLEHLEELEQNNRNFDFYWYPRSDNAKIRVMNKKKEDMPKVDWGTLDKKNSGPSHKVLPRTRHLKFDETEYALPREAGPECFNEVRKRIKKKWRKSVGWRVLYRNIQPDQAYLSPFNGRESVTISLHQNAGLPFQEFFADMEPIFRDYGGRPHWGKKHGLKAGDLQHLYPEWEKFHHYRKMLDPEKVFITSYLEKLLFAK